MRVAPDRLWPLQAEECLPVRYVAKRTSAPACWRFPTTRHPPRPEKREQALILPLKMLILASDRFFIRLCVVARSSQAAPLRRLAPPLIPDQGAQDAQALGQDARSGVSIGRPRPKADQHRHQDIGLKQG